ncbi:hypothetical protein GOBAR_DD25450 [Gossypium barbadense]|nr:hypothetical protein GOBAR_DD25450 [Gossypium barbadense]
MGRNRSYHEGLPQSVSNVVTFIRLYLRELSFPGEGSRLCVGVPERLLLFFEYSVSTADLEFTHVIVEANSLAVVKKANSLHDDRSEIAGNRVAHHLAAMGVGQSLDQFWVEEVPLSVEPTVAAVRWWVNLPD